MAIYILTDIEARGETPISGTMTEFGAVAVDSKLTKVLDTFHGVLIEAIPDPEIPAIPYFDENSKRYDATEVFTNFAQWLNSFNDRVVFVSDNPTYDGMWIWCGFDAAGIKNPFGHSGRRIGDFAAGLKCNWNDASSWKKYRKTIHDHNPVNDSLGNAEALIHLVSLSKNK